jgi:hypothetical protein
MANMNKKINRNHVRPDDDLRKGSKHVVIFVLLIFCYLLDKYKTVHPLVVFD